MIGVNFDALDSNPDSPQDVFDRALSWKDPQAFKEPETPILLVMSKNKEKERDKLLERP